MRERRCTHTVEDSGILAHVVTDEEKDELWRVLCGSESTRPRTDGSGSSPGTGAGPVVVDSDDVDAFQPSSPQAVVQDYFEQLEALLARLQSDTTGRALVPPANAGRVTASKYRRVAQMPAREVVPQLEVLRRIVVHHACATEETGSTRGFAFTVENLVRVAQRAQEPVPPGTKLPSSKDRDPLEQTTKGTLSLIVEDGGLLGKDQQQEQQDEEEEEVQGQQQGKRRRELQVMDVISAVEEVTRKEATAPTFLLSILWCVVMYGARTLVLRGELERLSTRVAETLFGYLGVQYRPGARQLAGECIGALTEYRLDAITELFLRRLAQCRSSDSYREFSVHQLAMGYFHLSLAREDRVAATHRFFASMAAAAAKMSRAVIRHSFCESLSTLIDRCFLSRNGNRGRQWGTRPASKELEQSWLAIFGAVRRWARTDKSRLPALLLLLRLSVVDAALTVRVADEFLQVLLPDLRDARRHALCVRVALTFVECALGPRGVPLTGDALQHFCRYCDTILPALFFARPESRSRELLGASAHSTSAPSTSTNALVAVLCAMHRKGANLCERQFVPEVLRQQAVYAVDERNAVFRALAQVAARPGALSRANVDAAQLWLRQYFLDVSPQPACARAVLLCFPRLCRPDARARVLTERALPLAATADADTLNLVATAVLHYVAADPHACLLAGTRKLLDILFATVDLALGPVLKCVTVLCKLLDAWQEKQQGEMSGEQSGQDGEEEEQEEEEEGCTQTVLDREAWRPLREHLEGLFLVLVLFDEPEVWMKALFLGDTLAKPAFQRLEAAPRPCVVEQFRGVDTTPAAWRANITRFAQTFAQEGYGPLVEWTWFKLRSLATPRVAHWRNNLRFLLVATRVPDTIASSSTTSQEEQPAGCMFLQQVTARYFAPNSADDSAPVLLATLPDMDQGCLAPIVAAVEDERARFHAAGADRHRKALPFYQQEGAMALYAGVLAQMAPATYRASTSVRTAYRALVDYVVKNYGSIATHPPLFRAHVAQVLGRFYELEGAWVVRCESAATSSSSKEAGMGDDSDDWRHSKVRDTALSRTVLEVLKALLEAGRPSEAGAEEAERTVVEAMGAVVEHGALSATYAATTLVSMLCGCAGRGPHVEAAVVDALAGALHRAPETLVALFVARSFEFATPLFVEAVARCAAADLDWWLAHCAMVRTVCFALVQYACLRAPGPRAAALGLANLLAGDGAAQHEGGRFHTRQCLTEALANHTSPTVDFMQPLNARRYSDALAARHPLATPAFVQCVAEWFGALSASGRHAVLQLLPAWLANYQAVFADDHEQAPLVGAVLAVARAGFAAGLLAEVEALWRSLVAPAATPDAVAFLVHRLVAAATAARAQRDAPARECATFALACLARTHAHRMVWDALAVHWPQCPPLLTTADYALDTSLLPSSCCSSSSPSSSSTSDGNNNTNEKQLEEMTSMQMAVSLLSERPRECPDEHLAQLLQAVHVQCRTSADETDRLVGLDTLNFALGAVLQDEREVARWPAAAALVAREASARWTSAALLATVALLAPLYPRLRACWRVCALDWAAALLLAADERRAIDALHIAALLWLRAPRDDEDDKDNDDVRALVPRLQTLVLRAVATCRSTTVTAALDVVSSIPPALLADPAVWPRLVDTAAALLESPSATIDAAACDTLRCLFMVRVGGDKNKEDKKEEAAGNEMAQHLAFLAKPDVSRLCGVLVRGTLAAATLPGALWLCGLAARHARALGLGPADCDAVAAVGTTVHGVLLAARAVGAADAAQHYAHALAGCCDPAGAETLAHALTAMDDGALPVAQQQPAHTRLAAHLVPALATALARPAAQHATVDTLLALLRKGPRRWRPAALDALALLAAPPLCEGGDASDDIPAIPLSASQRLQTVELVTLYARSAAAPPALAAAADRALVALLARQPIPRGCTMRFFECTHSVPPEPTGAGTDNEPPAELFGAIYPEEAVVLAARCAQSYAARVFPDGAGASEKVLPLEKCTLLDAARLRAVLQTPAAYPYDVLAARRARTPPATAPAHELRPFDDLPVHVVAGVAAQADFLAASLW